MNQITIEELSAYLPYKIQGTTSFLPITIFIVDSVNSTRIKGYTKKGNNVPIACNYKEFKPFLRPLSQLNTEIEVNGEKFVPSQDELLCKYEISTVRGFDFFDGMGGNENIFDLPYCAIQYLLSLHFDIFGLLDKNLAEPIV